MSLLHQPNVPDVGDLWTVSLEIDIERVHHRVPQIVQSRSGLRRNPDSARRTTQVAFVLDDQMIPINRLHIVFVVDDHQHEVRNSLRSS